MTDDDYQKIRLSVPDEFVGEKEWFFLYWVAYLSNFNAGKPIQVSDLVPLIPISQQTISRRIIELETKGFLKRTYPQRISAVEVTERGLAQLAHVKRILGDIFNKRNEVSTFIGKVNEGMGEGKHYIQKSGYYEQFEEKLGYRPFLGTLNLEMAASDYRQITDLLAKIDSIIIKGFRDNTRSYGNVLCYKVELSDPSSTDGKTLDAALLRIERTSHKPFVLEFISSVCVRDYFTVGNGNRLCFKILSTDVISRLEK